MLVNILGFLVFVALTGVFGWLSVRAGRSRDPLMRWGVFSVLGFFVVIFVTLSILTAMGLLKVYGGRGNDVREVIIDKSPDRVARGAHIAEVVCASCHSSDGALPLSSGGDVLTRTSLPLGRAFAPNLTPGGRLKDWTDGEVIRAVREGADKQGRLLVVMADQGGRNLSDDDLHAVAAYLRSQPVVTATTPDEEVSLVGVILIGAGLIPVPPAPTPDYSITAPPRGQTEEYGKYVVGFTGCAECHGEDLDGGTGGLAPQGPSLRVVKGWTKEQFAETLRTGMNPSGRALDAKLMPWKSLGRLDDQELGAVYAYLLSQEDVPSPF